MNQPEETDTNEDLRQGSLRAADWILCIWNGQFVHHPRHLPLGSHNPHLGNVSTIVYIVTTLGELL